MILPLDSAAAAREPQIDEEAGGAAVVADEVAHEGLGDVGIESEAWLYRWLI